MPAVVATVAALGLSACAAGRDADPRAGAAPAPARQYRERAPVPSADRPGTETARVRVVHEQLGLASWYGERFHGRRTASGQRFDMNGMTAAHPSLPFGTRVRVTNLANGRSVELVINDRGPFAEDRVIDVSRHAATHLGFLRAGLAQVRVRVLEAPGA